MKDFSKVYVDVNRWDEKLDMPNNNQDFLLFLFFEYKQKTFFSFILLKKMNNSNK